MKIIWCLLIPCVLLCLDVHGQQTVKEDLSACKLPHGEVLLPDRNSADGQRGYLFRFSDQKHNRDPFQTSGEQPKSLADFLRRIRDEKVGDLVFSPLNEGTFISLSGKMSDLGEKLLQDFNGWELKRPQLVESTRERNAAGEGTPGAIEQVKEGNCYLLETTDGKFALIRFIRKQDRYALIQFVFQPNGSRVFTIPKGEVQEIPEPRPVLRTVSQPTAAASSPPQKPDGKAVVAARDEFVSTTLGQLKNGEIADSQKGQVIETLGKLRSPSVVSYLIQNIDWVDPFMKGNGSIDQLRPHPCLYALEEIGKPSSLAALIALLELPLEVAEKDRAKVEYKVYLLAQVARRVEGQDVAIFMIEREMAKTAPERRKYLEAALEHVKKWK